jgi:diacylglycerol kinase (ATP)
MVDRRGMIGVLSNPLSGGNRKGLGAIRKGLSRFAGVIHWEAQTPEEVSEALADFARKGVEILAVNGGDGTIQAVLTVLFHHKPFAALPLLALLRSGTTSMNAGDVGLTGSAPHALRRLIRWTRTGHGRAVIEKRFVLQVQAPGREPLYGMFFGAAGICQGIRFFHTRANSLGLRGEWMPGLVIARFLFGVVRRDARYLSPTSIAISINGNRPERWDCLAVLVTTLRRLFLGMRPFWGREIGPVHFSALRAHPRHLVRAVPHLVRGRAGRYGIPGNGYLSHNVNELRLTLEGEFALDGELYFPDNHLGPVVVRSGGEASFLRL